MVWPVKWKDKHDGGFPTLLKKITSNDQLQIVQIASDFPFAQKYGHSWLTPDKRS